MGEKAPTCPVCGVELPADQHVRINIGDIRGLTCPSVPLGSLWAVNVQDA